MAPAKCPTEVLKHVCKLMNKSSPRYILIPEDGSSLPYVRVMDRQYEGKISRLFAKARASAASNALKHIIHENSELKKDELVEEYLGRLEDDEETDVVEPLEELCMECIDAVMSMTNLKFGVLTKVMMKEMNKEECEKFLDMSIEERYKWLEEL